MSGYWALRRAVTDVLDAEVGDDVVALRRMLMDALAADAGASEPFVVWLDLAPGVQIQVNRYVAETMTEKQLAQMYREHVWGASRKQAKEWARRQIALRAAARVSPGGGTKQ